MKSGINKVNVEFIGNDLVVTLPQDKYEELESLLQQRYRISLETAIRQFIMWSVTAPEEFGKWIREAPEYTTFLEEENE